MKFAKIETIQLPNKSLGFFFYNKELETETSFLILKGWVRAKLMRSSTAGDFDQRILYEAYTIESSKGNPTNKYR